MERASSGADNQAGNGSRGWRLYVAFGILATAIYFLPSLPAPNALYNAVALSAALAMAVGARRNAPAHPAGWYLLACGLLSLVAGDVVWTVYEDILEVTVPYPSLADVLYLLGYPLLAAGLAMMVRARAPWRDDAGLIDANILAIGAGVLSWVFFVSPYMADPSLSLLGVAVTVAYTLADVLLLAVLARLMLGGGVRTPAYYFLALGILTMLVSDVVYTGASIAGTYHSGDLLDAGWLLSYVCFGAAALHPSMGALTTPAARGEVRFSPRRLALLVAASLAAPSVLMIQYLRGEEIDVPVIFAGSVALFLLVSFRMAALAGELNRHRGEARFRSLVQNASDAIMVLDAGGAVRYASPSATRVTGYREEELLENDFLEHVHPDDAVGARRLVAESLKSPVTGLVEPAGGSVIELRYIKADGSLRHMEASVSNLLEDPNVSGLLLTARDVTERKSLEQQLRHRAVHDVLTNLPNRELFMDRLQHALDRSARYLISTAVLFLDLDNFKVVNDSLGHEAGDDLLLAVAERLESCLRTGDTVARLGGDEFTILLEDVAGVDEATTVAGRIMQELDAPVTLGGQEVFVGASIGIALSTSGLGTPEEMLRDADAAMYEAKARGKGGYEVFDPGMNERVLERLQLESELHRALWGEELRLYYQPGVFLANGSVTGFEALLRWEHPIRGILPPSEFLTIAEECGLIVPIGKWVLREACRQTREWQQLRPSEYPITVSVNVSARQFQNPGFLEEVEEILEETGLDPATLILEITESLVMEDSSSTRDALQRLKDLGLRLAIDDFGTGYSSLSYLKDFPVEVLKIDRSFVDRMTEDPRSASIVSTIIAFANSLGLSVTAEGIENAEQLARLKELGCPVGQGYHFSRPIPVHEARELITAPSPR